MLPQFVVSLFFVLIAALTSATFSLRDSVTANSQSIKADAQLAVSKSVEDFFIESGSLPLSFSALVNGIVKTSPTTTYLANRGSYWHLRQYLPITNSVTDQGGYPAWVAPVRIQTSNSLPVGLDPDFYNYVRVGIFAPYNGTLSDSSLLSAANNACPTPSSTGFADSKTWCWDPLKAKTTTKTDRTLSMPQETKAYQYAQKTADKFVVRYDAVYKSDAANAFPPAAVATELRVLVTPVSGSTVGTTPQTCNGTFYWAPALPVKKPIVLECGDLYNYWGASVKYRKLNNKQIELTSDSKFFQSDGSTLKVVTTGVTLPY
jgi:hypothetical protein